MRKLLMLLIQAYRYLISPLLPPRCRYLPTCSDYALQSVSTFGVRKGGLLAIKRFCRCHPWGGSGYDPVPQSCCSGKPANRAADHNDTSPRLTVQ